MAVVVVFQDSGALSERLVIMGFRKSLVLGLRWLECSALGYLSMVVSVGVIRVLLPRACWGAFSVLVGFVGIGRDQLRSGLGFSNVDNDDQDVISFVS